jgi:hypothetical protein
VGGQAAGRRLVDARRNRPVGLDAISELNVKGYERSIRHYTGPPLPLRPAVHWTNGPPEGCDEPWRDPG